MAAEAGAGAGTTIHRAVAEPASTTELTTTSSPTARSSSDAGLRSLRTRVSADVATVTLVPPASAIVIELSPIAEIVPWSNCRVMSSPSRSRTVTVPWTRCLRRRPRPPSPKSIAKRAESLADEQRQVRTDLGRPRRRHETGRSGRRRRRRSGLDEAATDRRQDDQGAGDNREAPAGNGHEGGLHAVVGGRRANGPRPQAGAATSAARGGR